MKHRQLKYLVTGASGYVGSVITNYLREKGSIVYELKHLTIRPLFPHNEFVIPYKLEFGIDNAIFKDIDVIVHCAYDFRQIKWRDILQVNVKGSLQLLKSAKRNGVRKIIYISTMSAFEGCKSLYGKAKLQIEKEALSLGAIIIRPGLIFGPNPGGMIGSLNKLVSKSRILPLIESGNQRLYLAHEEDLCRLIYYVYQESKDKLFAPIIAASEKALTFRSILEALAEAKEKKLIFIPISQKLILAGLKGAEMIGLQFGFRSDNLISLVNQNPTPSFEITRKTNIKFRNFLTNIKMIKSIK